MNYMTVKETANKWNISERYVQRYCTEGRIVGAVKHGNAWAIPENAEKPTDMRKVSGRSDDMSEENKASSDVTDGQPSVEKFGGGYGRYDASSIKYKTPMPLLNTPFELGHAMEAINSIEDDDSRNIAFAEYYYFSGQAERASEIAEKYLDSEDIGLKVSACWIYAYANLSLDRIYGAQQAMEKVKAMVRSVDDSTPKEIRGLAVCISISAAVLMHLPMPKILHDLKEYLHILPPGLRLFVLHVNAHHCYINKKYGACIGVAETALMLEGDRYPIPTVYLHLVAAMGYINLKQTDEAKAHLQAAWDIAFRDGLIEPFAEYHGLLSGLLEATMKKDHPEEFKRIIAMTYKFSAGWRKVHNKSTGRNVADNLTTTEFAVAMLASRDWTNKEIAVHMGISENTVKSYITVALQKLNISQRKALREFMLH